MNPADELRDAAAKLRETYTEFINHKDVRGDIDLAEWSEWFGPDAGINLDEINAWIALMSPALAEPLAAWLEETADVMTCLGPVTFQPYKHGMALKDGMGTPRSEWERALKVARVIIQGGDR